MHVMEVLEDVLEEEPEEESLALENLDPDKDKSEGDIIDEMTGQMKLF